MPAFHASACENPAMSWGFQVRHYVDEQRQARDPKYQQGQGVLYPRAAALGGCTAHNAMIFMLAARFGLESHCRGHRRSLVARVAHAPLCPKGGSLPSPAVVARAASHRSRFFRTWLERLAAARSARGRTRLLPMTSCWARCSGPRTLMRAACRCRSHGHCAGSGLAAIPMRAAGGGAASRAFAIPRHPPMVIAAPVPASDCCRPPRSIPARCTSNSMPWRLASFLLRMAARQASST